MYSKNVELKKEKMYCTEFRVPEDKLKGAAERAVTRLKKTCDRFYDKFPQHKTGFNNEQKNGWSNNRYASTNSISWTTGMWTGTYWLAYLLTNDDVFKDTALNHIQYYADLIDNEKELDDHDTGFKFTPSCVAAYKLTGDETAKNAALRAAEILFEHYCPVNKFIIRVGKRRESDPYEFYRTLVDSMMNIPLFFWAYEQTGDKKYYDAAVGHYTTTAKYLIRENGSSYHHYQFDPKTLESVGGCTFQGYSDDSCWSRGHSWLVYGYPLAYKYTKDEESIDIHKAVTYYFLDNLPEDFIPFWDFTFTDGSYEPRDASASAVTACGLLEMCKYLPEGSKEKTIFQNAAHRLVNALIDKCENNTDDTDGLIHHVTVSKPHNLGVDSIETYGDYFYLEALLRLIKPETELFW